MSNPKRLFLVPLLALLWTALPACAQSQAVEETPAKVTKGKKDPAAKKDIAAKKAAAKKDLVDKGLQRPDLAWPPKLPDGVQVVTDSSPAFLKGPATIKPGVMVAQTPPTVDFLYFPGQTEEGDPWSVWGDGSVVGDKYYTAIGDHRKPFGKTLIYEYDSSNKTLRLLVNLKDFLEKNKILGTNERYTSAKVHSRLQMGSDGWLYYAGHRGSSGTTTDEYGFEGEWIFRTNPTTGVTEIVADHPAPKHTIPASELDPERMIFYGGTSSGFDASEQDDQFLAYDLKNRKVLKIVDGGPNRNAIFSKSTGCLYWNGKKYDPSTNEITQSNAPEPRAATQETAEGIVYGMTGREADIWAYNVKTDTLTPVGDGAVGTQEYTTTIDIDPTGRYLYYIPGAHGGSENDGTPIVQYDVKTNTRKVIAFLHPFLYEKYGYTPIGTFSSALSPEGDKLYVTWNGDIGDGPKNKADFTACAMTVIHIPESERQP